MCLELYFTTFIKSSWGWASIGLQLNTSFPQEPGRWLPFSSKISQSPSQMLGHSCCHACHSAWGTEPLGKVCLQNGPYFLLLRFCGFLHPAHSPGQTSTWDTTRRTSGAVHYRAKLLKWEEMCLGVHNYFPLHLIDHQHQTWKANISQEHQQTNIISSALYTVCKTERSKVQF